MNANLQLQRGLFLHPAQQHSKSGARLEEPPGPMLAKSTRHFVYCVLSLCQVSPAHPLPCVCSVWGTAQSFQQRGKDDRIDHAWCSTCGQWPCCSPLHFRLLLAATLHQDLDFFDGVHRLAVHRIASLTYGRWNLIPIASLIHALRLAFFRILHMLFLPHCFWF